MLKLFTLKVSDERKVFCLRHGCNHWYLCIKEEFESDMIECEGFTPDESHEEFRVD